MIDRETVIKGLECCAGQCNYHECPYKDPCENANGIKQIMLDALALLKEQEAVRPIKKDAVEITARYVYECPCGAPLLIEQPYCAGCGRQVKWK